MRPTCPVDLGSRRQARLLDMAETFSELTDKSETWDRGNPGRRSVSPSVWLPFFRRVDHRLFSWFSKDGFYNIGFTSGLAAQHTMSPSIIPESRRCRTRARECRTMAERLRVQSARDQMLKAASDFERMARDAEQREIALGLTHLKEFATTQHPRSSGRRSG